ALGLLGQPRAALAARLDEAASDHATVAAHLETYRLWYRDALCLAAGGAATLVVNADRLAELAALARAVPVERLARAIDAVGEAWDALETNVAPRLALEHALVALPAPGATRAV
ncbi:MAG: DNA polymerase III subunit delta' C-terminal domain-containing protein, partial [Candidatus Rokuibacteriota bacterium]